MIETLAAGGAVLAGASLLGCTRRAASSTGPSASGRSGPSASPDAKPAAPAKAPSLELLILGGTGFLGPHIVRAALARGHRMTLFNRGKTNPHLFPELEKLEGDRDGQLDALRGRRWDAVIDTSGYVPRIVEMSARLLADAVEHYTFISTISVYASMATPNMAEDAPVIQLEDPTTEDVGRHYGGLKALCEQAAELIMPGRVANVRPGLIVGPGDPTGRFTYWPRRLARGGAVLAPGTGEDPVQYIDARDLAGWLITVVEARHVGIYNALGPAGRQSMAEMLAAIRTAVAPAGTRLQWAPADFLAEQEVGPWMDMPVWIPAEGDYAGAGTISNARAIARGLTFRPVGDTARDTLAWFQDLGAEEQKRFSGAGLSAEREAKVLAAWREKG